jgi:RimJ/RimL family protein N-acetyltransferase
MTGAEPDGSREHIGPLPRRVPLSIATPRLRLRFPRADDAGPLHAYFGDADSVRYTTGRAFSEAETWRAVAGIAGHWALRGDGPYVIERRDDCRVLGVCGIWFPGDWPEPEIKWALVPAARGQGIAREAAAAVLAMARVHVPALRPISLIRRGNAPSMALASAIGAIHERDLPFRGDVAHVYRHAAAAPVSIRAARREDAPTLAALHLASRRAHLAFAPIVHEEADVRRHFAEDVLPRNGTWVAEDRGEVIGYVSVAATPLTSGASIGRAVGWIEQLYVAPARVSAGVGTALMAQALRQMPRPLRLYTFAANTGARRFYERLGFAPIAFSDGSGNQERCPDVLYELA